VRIHFAVPRLSFPTLGSTRRGVLPTVVFRATVGEYAQREHLPEEYSPVPLCFGAAVLLTILSLFGHGELAGGVLSTDRAPKIEAR